MLSRDISFDLWFHAQCNEISCVGIYQTLYSQKPAAASLDPQTGILLQTLKRSIMGMIQWLVIPDDTNLSGVTVYMPSYDNLQFVNWQMVQSIQFRLTQLTCYPFPGWCGDAGVFLCTGLSLPPPLQKKCLQHFWNTLSPAWHGTCARLYTSLTEIAATET